MSREPWKYSENTERILTDFLRLRHKLIPYIYTMNYKCYNENITLIRPLYYYTIIGRRFKNEYYFGDSFIVSPITSKIDGVTKMGHTRTYLPEGVWFDYFTKRKYIGDRYYNNYRDLSSIPVFVKAGSIIPSAVLEDENGVNNPSHLKIEVFPLSNGEFDLYEDDGISLNYQNGENVITKIKFDFNDNPTLTIKKPVGDLKLIPAERKYTVCFVNVASAEIEVTSKGRKIEFNTFYENRCLYVSFDIADDDITVKFLSKVCVLENDWVADMDRLIMRSVIQNNDKVRLGNIVHGKTTPNAALIALGNDNFDVNFKNAAIEIMTSGLE